jgi:hypothetical protein
MYIVAKKRKTLYLAKHMRALGRNSVVSFFWYSIEGTAYYAS